MELERRALTMRESMDEWYVIEWAQHENREWFEPTEWGSMFMTSSRISKADIEGPAEHMLGIARAILEDEEAHYKRCYVKVDVDRCYMRSPRNDEEDGVVHIEDARDLARHILATLGDARGE